MSRPRTRRVLRFAASCTPRSRGSSGSLGSTCRNSGIARRPASSGETRSAARTAATWVLMTACICLRSRMHWGIQSMNTNGRAYTIRTIVRKIQDMEQIDGRRQRGDASRRVVLANAADLASVEGLDGLSIARLAAAANVSKSGVATLFGTKERLQLAAVDAAAQRFRETVLEPARVEPRGIRRIVALLDAWIAYSRDRVFPGGCFFAAAAADFDSKPGPVRDAIARAYESWNDYVRVSVGYAVDQGELATDTDAAQLAFEFMALLDASNTRSIMTGSKEPYRAARRALVARLLGAGADPEVLRPLAEHVD